MLVSGTFGIDLNRWIWKVGVQVSVDDIACDINCEHSRCHTLDNGLVEKYVDSMAHGDPIHRI